MQTARIAAALFVIAAACGTSPANDDAGTDAGVCCPITGELLPCGCAHGGGWAPRLDQCSTKGICDGARISQEEHGCDVLVIDNTSCCLCPPTCKVFEGASCNCICPQDSGVTDAATQDVTGE